MDLKRERFKKVASLRTNKVLDSIRVLGNCSNKHNYSYTDKEVKQMFDEIEDALRKAKALFTIKSTKNKKFEFKD